MTPSFTLSGAEASAACDGDRVTVLGIPSTGDRTAERLLRYRLTDATQRFLDQQRLTEIVLRVGTMPLDAAKAPSPPDAVTDPDTRSIADRASHYVATDPDYQFDFLVLPEETIGQLMLAVNVVLQRPVIFGDWGLRKIEPHPSAALNFHGKPGTGKTLAAHAIADRLGRKILVSKCSQLESKYHGEGPKNLDALFLAAQEQDAVLFLDEADSLMSRRFEATSHGSEQAVNAMRSELLMLLDRFEGLVIFATNFVQSYDSAFDTRVRHVHFPDPDHRARAAIWRNHLLDTLPKAGDVDAERLAEIDGLCGREICRAVIDAATTVAVDGQDHVTYDHLAEAARNVMKSRIARPEGTPKPAGPELTAAVASAVAAQSTAEPTRERR
jgi:SpoVK/Ycf46/Vps4 family AAA+-type ATPase